MLEIAWTAAPAVARFGVEPADGRDLGHEPRAVRHPAGDLGHALQLDPGLAIGTFFGLSIAIFLSQDFLPPAVETLLKNLDRAARRHSRASSTGSGASSSSFPPVRPLADWLHRHLGWIPFFGTPLSGPGMLPASLVLAIMVLPTVSALSRDALVAVPPKLKEAAFGLGATRWEAILGVLVPTALTGIFGSIMLGFGRALGETMALAMLVGNANTISVSLFSPANTLAALLALNFPGGARAPKRRC